jgi:glycine/serine hydroxymethyltransferase
VSLSVQEVSMSMLHEQLARLARATADNNRWRQSRCFNLIPSETTPSLLVKLCEIADPAGRYAEHRTLKGREVYYYQGTDFIEQVEEEARTEICRFFECTEAELRPISGQMANEVVFKAILRRANADDPGKAQHRLRLVLNNDLTKGGHLSAQPMGALFNYVDTDATGNACVVHFPLQRDNPYRTDLGRLADLLEQHRPDLVILGKSMFLYPEPVREVAELVQGMDPRPILHYDMAHVLGLYGAFQAPLQEGADLVTGSTHKTFFGPQRGVVVSNLSKDAPLRKLWLEIKSRAFPGSTSNHHLGTLLGLAIATHEMNACKETYQDAVLRNARAFARALDAAGVQVEGNRADGFTFTHQVIIRVREHGSGEAIARRLEENNLLTNYQALPDDASFADTSGVRMGVQEMTRFGMVEADFEHLAAFVADVVLRGQNVAEAVARERARFLDMQYCLPAAQALPLAAQVLATMLPASGYAQRFAEALAAVARASG